VIGSGLALTDVIGDSLPFFPFLDESSNAVFAFQYFNVKIKVIITARRTSHF